MTSESMLTEKSLSLYDAEVTVEALTQLPDELDSLALYGKNVNDDALTHVSRMTGLRSLTIVESRVTDEGLDNIKALPQLERLSLGGSGITDAGVDRLKNLSRLTFLCLSYTQISDAALTCLAGLSELRELRLGGTKITGSKLTDLAVLGDLQQLTLDRTGLNDDGLRALASLTQLESLELQSNDEITDDGIVHLEALRNLRTLHVYDTEVSERAVDMLRVKLPKSVKVYHTSRPRFDVQAFWKSVEEATEQGETAFGEVLADKASSLDPRKAMKFARFVADRKPSCYVPLLRNLTDEQFAAVSHGARGFHLTAWRYLALERDAFYDHAYDLLAPQLAFESADDRSEPAKPSQPVDESDLHGLESQLRDFLTGDGDASTNLSMLVRRLRNLVSASDAEIQPETVELIAENLECFTIEGLACAVPLVHGVLRPEWTVHIRRAWFRVKDAIARHAECSEVSGRVSSVLPVVAMAARSIAAAWAVEAAKDKTYRDFEKDQRKAKEFEAATEECRDWIAEMKRLREELVKAKNDGRDLENPKEKKLKGKLNRYNRMHEDLPRKKYRRSLLKQGCRDSLSVGYLLQQVLLNALHFPAAQQAAALGLSLLASQGHLNRDVKEELEDQLKSVFSSDDHRRIREYRVCLMPNSTREELHDALCDAVEWMLAMSTYRHTALDETQEPAEFRGALRTICDLMQDKIPGYLRFLQRCPLRLMWLDDHEDVLELYRRGGYGVRTWPRFEGRYREGPVESRFLELDDRTSPNSGGICFNLLRYPILAVPVLFHEQLHFGGMTGQTRDGLVNEMDVKLRELAFARGLIAEMAPHEDEELPEFESKLVEAMRRCGIRHLACELLMEFDEDGVLAEYNKDVARVYGSPVDDQATEDRIDEVIKYWNEEVIGKKNENQDWHPKVEWPKLETDETAQLTRDFRRRLRERWMISHTLSPDERDTTSQEPVIRSAVEMWNSYKRRLNATDVLKQACSDYRENGGSDTRKDGPNGDGGPSTADAVN